MLKEYSRTKNSMFNVLSGLGGQLLNIILKFVCRTIFIQTLGVEYLGINGLFSDVLSMLSIAELGFDTAISFRLYRPIADNNTRKIREYLLFFRTVYRIIGLFIFCLGLLFIPFLRYVIKDYDSLEGLGVDASFVFILFLIQNVSSYLFFAYKSIILRANQKSYVLNVVGYGITIASNLFQILSLLLFKDFTIYLLVLLFFVILQNLINARLATHFYPQFFDYQNERLSVAERKELFKDCAALFVYKVNNIVMKATDNIVLSAFVGLTIVGLYSTYLMVFVAVIGILNTTFRAVKASIGNLFATDDLEKKYFFFEVMNFVTIVLYGTAAVCIAVTSNEFITCWIGEKYTIPQPFPLLIGIELLVTGLKLNLGQIRQVSGIFKQLWYRPVIGSFINVVASIILVQVWGISGVITGTLLAYIFANLMVDPVVIHRYTFKCFKPVRYYYSKNVMFIVLLGIIGFVAYYLCTMISIENNILSFLVHLFVCLISVIPFFCLVFRNRAEFQYLSTVAIKTIRARN